MLRRKIIAFPLISLILVSSGLALGQTGPETGTNGQATQINPPSAPSAGSGASTSQPDSAHPTKPAEEPVAAAPVQLSPAEQKAADNKAALDALLEEAGALKISYENSRRARSKSTVSLSTFRSMELRLQMAAAADPGNGAALEMANAMRMIQYDILQPSVQIAAVANRELYAREMGQRMQDDGLKVEALGRGNSTVRFISPQMTRRMAMQLVETAKIPEQARALQFRQVVFSSGRRSWTFDLARGRLR